MNSEKLRKDSQALQETLVAHRRYLHENPELHLDLPGTKAYVTNELKSMGYEPQECGYGIVALAGGKNPGKTFLLRADMDALPIAEETDEPFKSENGRMHACGHDLHTAMLLGAAKLLKEREDEICGSVKLMFQPAEETLVGAKNMIENGLLENPKVDAGAMIHVFSGFPAPTGLVLVMPPAAVMAASDWFTIRIQGKGGHGAMPYMGVDPINVAVHIHLALQELHARELTNSDGTVLTVGMIRSGETANVIPDQAEMQGTIRTFNAETRAMIKERLVTIAEKTAEMFRATAAVEFPRGCPSNASNADLAQAASGYVLELFPELAPAFKMMDESPMFKGPLSGSEDFGYVSELIPSVMMSVTAGSADEGYTYPAHHPKARFDEGALSVGAAAYAQVALRWLEDNN